MKKDMLEKKLFAYNDVFAEIFNEMVFYGTGIVIDPDDLEDARARSVYSPVSDDDNSAREQERDVDKFWKKGNVILCLMGLENQTSIDATMPIRVMGYEGADYRGQIVDRDEALRAARKRGDDEAVRSIRSRKFYPVITVVLYMGIERRWNKYKSLYECLDMPPGFEHIVEDRHINVIELAWLPDEQEARLKYDMRLFVNMLKQLRTTGRYIPKSGDEAIHVEALIRLLQEFTGQRDLFYQMLLDKPYIKDEGGRVKMIDIFGGQLELEYAKGEAVGLSKGRAEKVKSALDFMKQSGVSKEIIDNYRAMNADVVLTETI